MKLTIIIPCYNVEGYIKPLLEVLTPQVNDYVQIILIDDASTDNTVKEIKSVKGPQILITNDENHGVSHSRNTGIKNATGEYIAFIDADDMVSADYVDTILSYIKSNKDYYKITWETKGVIYNASNLPPWNCSCWSRVWRKDIIKELFDEKLDYAEDWKFMKDNIKKSSTSDNIHKLIYHYTSDRAGSLSEKEAIRNGSKKI